MRRLFAFVLLSQLCMCATVNTDRAVPDAQDHESPAEDHMVE